MFFSDARTPKENVLGGVNNGWAVANTLLAYERGDDANESEAVIAEIRRGNG